MQTPAPERHPMAAKRLAYHVDGAETVDMLKNVSLTDGVSVVDIYRPHGAGKEPRGWVLFVNGFSDIGARTSLGCAIKDMAAYDSWGRAVAARGMVGVTHATSTDAAADVRHVWSTLRAQGETLGIAPHRGAIWACSAHVPNALGLLLDRPSAPVAAAFCYGYMLDLDGDDAVAHAQGTWRFAHPAHGKHVADLAQVPLLIVRAGRDATPGVNTSIDAFVRHGLAENADLTVANYADCGHAFDLDEPDAAGAAAVELVLGFLARHTAR